MAQTRVLGRAANPSPAPDPQSFQKPMPGTRDRGRRASPIIENAQSREGSESKR